VFTVLKSPAGARRLEPFPAPACGRLGERLGDLVAYHLTIEERPTYVYARVDGDLTPANALRFLEEANAACVKSGRTDVLLDMQLHGPNLNTTSVYDVISQRAAHGSKLRKIAYVPYKSDDQSMAYFAETVAMNRGVNVRLFESIAAAERWLVEP
jgi:hypothetical protein